MLRRVRDVTGTVLRARRLRVQTKLLRSPPQPALAHHGIQRSGTNYLCALLESAGVFVVNAVDPKRSSPVHKHFRWQTDKGTIVMDRAYGNDVRVSTIDELNSRVGYPLSMRHVVVFKRPSLWLASVGKWGVANGWLSADSGEAEIALALADWLTEWEAYYSFWSDVAMRSPRSVSLIDYEELAADPPRVLGTVFMNFDMGHLAPAIPNGKIAKVPHSPRRGATSTGAGSLHEKRASHVILSLANEEFVNEVISWDWQVGLRQT